MMEFEFTPIKFYFAKKIWRIAFGEFINFDTGITFTFLSFGHGKSGLYLYFGQ